MKRILSGVLLMMLLTLVACGNPVAAYQEQYDLGVRHLSEGNYEEAILAFTAAIEIDPKRAESYAGLADSYLGQGDTDHAIKALEDGYAVTGESELQEKLDKLKDWISPKLTVDEKVLMDQIYAFMEKEDFTGMYHFFIPDGDKYNERLRQYKGYCYDGKSLSPYHSGVGLKFIDDVPCYYFGPLLQGTASGNGAAMMLDGNLTALDSGETFRTYRGQWDDDKPNGAGILTNEIGNTAGEQCSTTWEGNWTGGLLDGEVVNISYIAGKFVYEVHYACALGKYKLDDRWEKTDEHDPYPYSIPPVRCGEISIGGKVYQPDFIHGFLYR
ncbi:MAG: tetratricopeptide repeat protein [Oscillospiraceae bacterium]